MSHSDRSEHRSGPATQQSGNRLTGPAVAAAIALAIHTLLFFFDVRTHFEAFDKGDRGVSRLQAMETLGRHGHFPGLDAMLQAPIVPGEYLFVMEPWLAWGPSGVIWLQIILLAGSCWLIGNIARQYVPWRPAAWVCPLVYALLPQNIVYPHQLVTEAVATPLTVAWTYFALKALRSRDWGPALAAGACLGAAIITRPAIMLLVPTFVGLLALYAPTRAAFRKPGVYLMSGLAVLPLLLWAAIFAANTGHSAFNTGNATLGWNLRSKALIVEQANGITPTADLVPEHGTITVGRYLSEASRHKPIFAKLALLDTATVFGRGNSTKVTIDYLGFDRNLKEWRKQMVYAKGAQAPHVNMLRPTVLIEGVATVLTALFSAFCIWHVVRVSWAFVRGTPGSRPDTAALTAITAALMTFAFLSAHMVDQAQARLRNPAEGMMLIFVAMIIACRRHTPLAPA